MIEFSNKRWTLSEWKETVATFVVWHSCDPIMHAFNGTTRREGGEIDHTTDNSINPRIHHSSSVASQHGWLSDLVVAARTCALQPDSWRRPAAKGSSWAWSKNGNSGFYLPKSEIEIGSNLLHFRLWFPQFQAQVPPLSNPFPSMGFFPSLGGYFCQRC